MALLSTNQTARTHATVLTRVTDAATALFERLRPAPRDAQRYLEATARAKAARAKVDALLR